jgi:hypothetical protein
LLALFLFCSNDHFVQRTSRDYFFFEEGNWWRYASNDDTILVEVEPPDTILQIEFFPVSFGGYTKYLAEEPDAIIEYVNILYNFAGDDYTMIDDFIMRIELPLVDGHTWEDSLVSSLDVSGQQIQAKYSVIGGVTEFTYDEDFDGDVYTIEVMSIETLISSDTTVVDSNYIVEYYAPDIGLVRFDIEEGAYTLIDYEIQ